MWTAWWEQGRGLAQTGCWLPGIFRLKIYEAEARTWLCIVFLMYWYFGFSFVTEVKCGRILWVCVSVSMWKKFIWWCYEILISSIRFTAILMVSSHKHYLINGTMKSVNKIRPTEIRSWNSSCWCSGSKSRCETTYGTSSESFLSVWNQRGLPPRCQIMQQIA